MSHRLKQQELAVFGYVRRNYNFNVPFVLIRLMKRYFDEYFYWNVKGNQMSKFIQAKNGDVLYSKGTFKINDIIFFCTLCPSGWKQGTDGCVQFYVELKHLPSYIKNITIFTELTSETVSAMGRTVRNWNEANGISCWKRALLHTQFADIESAHFNCKLYLKAIEFAQDCEEDKQYKIMKDRYYIRPIKIKRKTKYEWIIDTDSLLKLNISTMGQLTILYSPIFDENWGIKCYTNRSDKDLLSSFLCCFSYPIGIHKMRVRFKVQSDHPSFMDTNRMAVFDDVTHRWRGLGDVKLPKEMNGKESITVTIEIEIVSLFDSDDEAIEPTEFSKYGVI